MLIDILKEQLQLANRQNKQLAEKVDIQSRQIEQLNNLVERLTASIVSLEGALTSKGIALDKEKNQKRALGEMLHPKSEKVKPESVVDTPEKYRSEQSAKKRGNNNAKRKEYFNLEIREHDIYPDHPDFNMRLAQFIGTTDSITYEVEPPKFIKHIHHLHSYKQNGIMLSPKAPKTPFLNSNFGASTMAYMLQLRYVFGMPIERVVKLFSESGFDLPKQTAHGLISKVAKQLDYLADVLKQAILEDHYIYMDETYYRVLNKKGSSTKVYIWVALSHNANLVQFFYNEGSRGRKVLTSYLPPEYQGAIHSDGLENYKIIETDEYPQAKRLACLQHCKRKFKIEHNRDAAKVTEIMNKLYKMEHDIPPDLPPEKKLSYKQTHAPIIYKELMSELLGIRDREDYLPKSLIGKAVEYTLKQYSALLNYIQHPDYGLDNNPAERIIRNIAISRKNSLFCCTHHSTNNAALIYSLACSCKINGLNSFDYFTDLLNKLADVNPKTSKEYLRNLLPDRWGKEK